MHPVFTKRIIIGGLPRAGTTLFRYILDASPEIISGPETGFFLQPLSVQQNRVAHVAARVHRAIDVPEDLVSAAILRSHNSFHAFDLMMAEYARRAGVRKTIWAEKTPMNCVSYHWLAMEDPRASFISLIRDGRDVLTSIVDGRHEYHVSVQRYVDTLRLVYGFAHPRHLIVRYEDLVGNPEQCLRTVFEFLEIPFDHAMLERYHEPALTRNAAKVRQPKVLGAISAEWIGRWRQPEHETRINEIHRDERVLEWLRRSDYPV